MIISGHDLTAKQAKRLTRTDLINWLCWNDRNGTYTDQDSLDSDLDPLTHAQALAYVLDQIGD